MTAKELLLHITKTAYNADEMALLSDVFSWRFVPPNRMERDPSARGPNSIRPCM